MLRLGLDIGGTKIEAAIMDDEGQIIERRRVATPRESYPTFIATVTSLVDCLRDEYDTQFSIGAGLPGAISPDTGLIKNSNCLILNGQDLKSDLSEQLEQKIYLANDADCFTLSEAIDGSGAIYSSVFGVIIGTGCGGGIVINKKLVTGPNAITGEWGHNPLPYYHPETDGFVEPCYCGQPICIESFISGTGFAKRFQPQGNHELTASQIIKLKESGDEKATQHYQQFIDMLARSLASVMNVLDPHAIVLGGGLSRVQTIYEDIHPALKKYLYSDQCNTKILQAKFGDSSGVRGACWLPHM